MERSRAVQRLQQTYDNISIVMIIIILITYHYTLDLCEADWEALSLTGLARFARPLRVLRGPDPEPLGPDGVVRVLFGEGLHFRPQREHRLTVDVLGLARPPVLGQVFP